MKNLVLLVLVMLTGTIACKKAEEVKPEKANQENLVGTWKQYKRAYDHNWNEVMDPNELEYIEGVTYTFEANGSGVLGWNYGNGTAGFTWSLSGKTLILNVEDSSLYLDTLYVDYIADKDLTLRRKLSPLYYERTYWEVLLRQH